MPAGDAGRLVGMRSHRPALPPVSAQAGPASSDQRS